MGTAGGLAILQAQLRSGTCSQSDPVKADALGSGGVYELQLNPRQQSRQASTSSAGHSEPGNAGVLSAARPLQRSLDEAVAVGNWRKAATVTEQLLVAGALGEELLSDQLIKGAARAL